MACLLCKRRGEKTFNINVLCGDAQYTIRDDIMEYLGSGIEDYLKPEDVVCNICMNMLDDVAKMKRRLLEYLMKPRENDNPFKLGKYWNFFAKNLKAASYQFDDTDYDEPITPSSLTPVSGVQNPNRSTPSPFWSLSHTKNYNPELEDRCARREMVKSTRRSQSKLSLRSVSSYDNDEEVARLFRGRKRRGRRPRSAGGLVKIMTKKLRRVQSENDRPMSSLSDQSCVSCTRLKKDFRPRTPKLVCEDFELVRPSGPKTRSISKLMFYCSECMKDKKDLEEFTAHMIEDHNRKAAYRCPICDVNYMTEEHLAIHEKIHAVNVICPVCGERQDDWAKLKKHSYGHLQYSVPCSYCDLAFLSQYEANLHIFNHHHHRGKKRKIKKPHRIQEIISYVKEDTNNKEPVDRSYSTKKYTAEEMILNVKDRPEFRKKSFEQLDFRIRHPQPLAKPELRTSLGDGLIVPDLHRFSRRSTSPSSFRSTSINLSDSDISSSDAFTFESPRRRKRIRSSHPSRKTSTATRDTTDWSYLSSDLSNAFVELDRLEPSQLSQSRSSPARTSPTDTSPAQTLPAQTSPHQTSSALTSSAPTSPAPTSPAPTSPAPTSPAQTPPLETYESDGSEIQTEMSYIVGDKLHVNVALEDIVDIQGSSDSNPHEGVEPDPNITND